ncbi:hypothetical protein IW261DRAFT_1572686 [Armillaria novae-zelandiae]|uniref:Uncharacterized protein n=1 Tax=Armillaria novae-zelandiae TaxID=153914 RepID=A0AA39TUY0_9AGAR|nr:hypothetical protein IW261DRAFT_1572686 [Armillaria novae-zelandiae]
MPGGDDDEIYQELMKIGELIKDVTIFEDRILNAAGIGDDLAEVQRIREGMQEVKRWLEDVLCGMLEGVDILTKAYQDHTLLTFFSSSQGKMALAGWCTPEQNVWFANQLVGFHRARLDGTIGQFLAEVVIEFMALWQLPECAETITGNSPEDVTRWAEQDAHYQKQKEQIENKFNNNHGKAHVAATTTATGKALATSPKKKKIIYSKRYYKKCMQPAVRKAIRRALTPLTQGQKLMLINKLTQETFQAESEDVKAEVYEALEQLHEERTEASMKGEQNPKDYLDAIDAAPTALDGPDPADGGNIQTGSFHVGANEHKQNFQDKYTQNSVNANDSSSHHMTFEEGIITPYGHFLKMLFSPEVRAQRACNQADLEALNATLHDDEAEATPEMSGLILMPPSPPLPPLPPVPLPPIPSCLLPSMQEPTISPSSPRTLAPVATSILHPSNSTPTSVDTTNSGCLTTSHHEPILLPGKSSSMEANLTPTYSGKMPALARTTSRWVQQDVIGSLTTTLLGRVVLDQEDESFPLSGCDSLEMTMKQAGDGDVDISIAPLPLVAHMPRTSVLTDVVGDLTPIPGIVNDKPQKRHHEAERIMRGGLSKLCTASHRQSRAAIAVGWLPSAIQYLTDPNLGSEWLDLSGRLASIGAAHFTMWVAVQELTGCYLIKTFVAEHMASKPTL